jgi:spermidine synthase
VNGNGNGNGSGSGSGKTLLPPLCAAALLTGFGGLLLQLAWLRRYGLLLGNTSLAAAQVLGVFLLGIGVGGLLVARARRSGVPLARASLLYAGVACAALLAEPALRTLPPLPIGLAQFSLLLVPGLPALGMGAAFPLLFAGLPRGAGAAAAGQLTGANLLGAVGGALTGGNFLLLECGLARGGQIAGACYLLAAMLVAWVARRTARPVPGAIALPPPVVPRTTVADRRLALGAGMLLVGCEVLCLRRLPFFLEGMQPTLCGIIAAVLVWNAAGAALLTPLLHKVLGARAAPLAAAAALLACNLGLHEHLVPALSRWPVESTAGMHVRVFVGASAAIALPCLCLGAVVPLLLAPFLHPETRSPIAGVLFGVQGLGELLGALLVGHALPALLPQAFFAGAPLLLSLAVLAVLRPAFGTTWTLLLAAAVSALALLGVSGAGTLFDPAPPARGSRFDRAHDYVHLGHRVDAALTASVAYNRAVHSMVLFTDEFRATETGPNTAYMRVLGHLPFLLRADLGRAAVIALGTGTTFDAVAAWPDVRHIDVVELSAAVVAVADRFTADGPVPDGRTPGFAREPRARLHLTDGRAFLARCAPASLDLITMEPLLPYAPGTSALYSAEFYALAGRALRPHGLLVQWLPTHALPNATFDTLLATFAQAFTHTSVWLVDHSTILVGSTLPHAPTREQLDARYAGLPDALRGALHEAGLAGATDVLAALVTSAPQAVPAATPARVLHDDAPFIERLAYWSGTTRLLFLPDNLLRLAGMALAEPDAGVWRDVRKHRLGGLHNLAQAAFPAERTLAPRRALLDFDAARVRAPDSVLLHREQARAARLVWEEQIAGSATVAQAQPAAERLLQNDPGSALALAALAANASDDEQRRRRLRAACALDPLLPRHLPPAFVMPDVRVDSVSPREDLGTLPAGAALAAAALGDGARAVAWRGTFPARVGQSLCALAHTRALTGAEKGALRPLLDPWLWQQLGTAVQARGGDLASELLPLWRRDLPALATLRAILDAPAASRVALAHSVGGRPDAAACELLARLLLDADSDVRRAAGGALTRTAGKRIPYDPEGAESARAEAAAALRRLHNPPP